MNYMENISKMLDVEINETFRIIGCDGEYYLSETGLYDTNGMSHSGILCGILSGVHIIIKKPWKPKYNEMYYYVDKSGEICSECWNNDVIDWNTYKLRNCYKYREYAEKYIDKWVKFYNSDDVINVE